MQNYDEKLIIKYIAESISIADVLRKIGLDPRGRNYRIVKDIISKFDIDTGHFLGKKHALGTHTTKVPIQNILIDNSEVILTTSRKRRLISEGLLQNKCYICSLTEWLGKSISLQIDHINGKNNDHRLENLRLLCPNCHSQTDTFAGRNCKSTTIKEKRKPDKNKCQCGKLKGVHNKLCYSCNIQNQAIHHTKIDWPTLEELTDMVINNGYASTSRYLGVSDDAIRKRLLRNGIKIPTKYPKRISKNNSGLCKN